MARIEDINTERPFWIVETKLLSIEEERILLNLDTPDKILQNKPFEGSCFQMTNNAMTLDRRDKKEFYKLLLSNQNLRCLVEKIGEFQGGFEDYNGDPGVSAQFGKNQFVKILKDINTRISNKVLNVINTWENSFITFHTYKVQ